MMKSERLKIEEMMWKLLIISLWAVTDWMNESSLFSRYANCIKRSVMRVAIIIIKDESKKFRDQN